MWPGEQWDRADVILTSMIIHDIQGLVSSGRASPCQLSPGGIKRDFGAEDSVLQATLGRAASRRADSVWAVVP